MYEVKITDTEKEAESAYELFYKSFGPNYYESKAAFDSTRRYDLTLNNNNLFIIKDEKNTVIATARTVSRNLKIFGEKFEIGGIATTAVHPYYRGKGLFNTITKFILNEMIDRNLSLCLVFARRAIDHIYVPHGFWGTPVERTFILLEPPSFDANTLNFMKMQIKDIPFLEKIYRYVHSGLSVFLDRPEYLWLAKMKNPKFEKQFDGYICTKKGTGVPIGYVIAESGKGIVDICACGEETDIYKHMLFSKNSPVRDAALTGLSLSTEHPAIKAFRGHAYSIYTRHPHYGGNILKILDPSNRESKIMKLVESKLAANGIQIPIEFDNVESHIISSVITAALFGYEIPETRDILNISEQSQFNTSKPIDFIFSSLDDF